MVRNCWSVTLLLAALCACSSSPRDAITIHTPPDLAPGTSLAVQDMISDLSAMTGRNFAEINAVKQRCVSGELHIVVLGHEHDASGARAATALAAQAYSIEETRCANDGHLVEIRGGSLLAAQWAIYDFMEHLGVRYFHPEQTYRPTNLQWPAEPMAVHTAPAVARRSLHLHRTHPIELEPPIGANPAEATRYQQHWIDWNVKLRHTDVDGIDETLTGAYAYARGFPREIGFNLLETQQGGRPVINPDDPRPEHEQISSAIDARMAPVAGLPPITTFIFLFNPNEFTTVGEALTVDRITFVTNYVHEHWPTVEIRTINHGAAQPLGSVYGTRFFDLPQFAPPVLGVEVHTLMFYDLDRPAPVYGNPDFKFLRDWIVMEQAKRRVTYYPESSWWLTFDLPVPLYLAPVSLEARDHDLQLLAPYLAGDNAATHGVIGHKAFSSGQEWGYWLIDYCTAQMTWQPALGWRGCLGYALQPLVQGAALRDLLVEVGEAQVAPLRDANILQMLVGSDDQTESAEVAGVYFHPLPPAPSAVLSWTDPQVADFERLSVTPMVAMAAQYAAWADRAAAIAALQSEADAPWVQEIVDGLRITGLRAQHGHDVYTTVLALRAALNARDYAAIDAAAAQVATARAVTTTAADIVAQRETAYRYPLELSTAGDEVGTPGALANTTIYPYRYLSRTHRLFYWTRPDAQLTAMFGFDLVSVNDRILPIGTALAPQVRAQNVHDVMLAWGDGATSTTVEPHTYSAQGFYDWTLDAAHQNGVVHHRDAVAIVATRYEFAKGSLHITAPQGASLIENLLPGFAIGIGTDGTGDFMALGQLDASMAPVTKGSLQRRTRVGRDSVAADLVVTLPNLGTITVHNAVITLGDGTGVQARVLTINGELNTDEVVQLVVAVGGFDEAGARDIVAGTLGYTIATLPVTLPMTIAATGSSAL